MKDIIEQKINDILLLMEKTGKHLVSEQQKKEYKTYIKEDQTIVTDLDFASSLLIKDGLKEIFGDVQLLSEENDINENNDIVDNYESFFLLDPIDGTNSFNEGGDFTINLAFCLNRKPQFGFIHNPLRNEFIFNTATKSFIKKNNILSEIIGLDKQQIDIVKELKILTGESSLKEDFMQIIQKEMQKKNYIITNIQKKSAMIKLKDFIDQNSNLFILYSKAKDWDILPTIPILEHAGILYSNGKDNSFKVRQNLDFTQPFFVSSHNKNIIEDILLICSKTIF